LKIKYILRELIVAQSFRESIDKWAVASDVIIGFSAPETWIWPVRPPSQDVECPWHNCVCVRVWYYLSTTVWNLIWKISRIPRGGKDITCCGAFQILEFSSDGSPSPITIVTFLTSAVYSGRAYVNWLLRRSILETQFSSPHSEVKNTRT
jgi:hypothetical protein